MNRDEWRQAKELFAAACDLPPDAREAFARELAGSEGVLAEVLRLLRHTEGAPGFLEPPAIERQATDSHADPLIGRRLGGFLIERRIGAGGMGAVYEARQEQPSRRAAVKVIRFGQATAAAVRRFEFESEVLARLQHPGIAHVYASGSFEFRDGVQPWFAMEFVEGPTLRSYAKERSLSTREKVELLIRVCEAVQHAHQRGVVHRDLKPANIVVVRGEQPAAIKVLDFGVARVLGHGAHATMHTAAGELVGTFGYMSPEQLAAGADEVDHRSDVYALGVIGYELISGRLPHAPKSSVPAELIRAAAEEAPARLGRHDPSLRGDLEVIFEKALERDRERRYGSAAELAADLRRFLNHEPILARPPTAARRLAKFTRRNRALVGGVAAAFLALAAGLAVALHQAARAEREAAASQYETDKAVAVSNFMVNDFLMNLLAAASRPGERLPAADLAAAAAERIGTMYEDQPLAEAAVRNEVATVFYNLGDFERAVAEFRLAMRLWEGRLGPDHPDTLKTVNNLGQSLMNLGRVEEAEPLYRRALAARLRVLGEHDPFTLVSMNNLAMLLRARREFAEAESLLRRTFAAQEKVHGPRHKHTLTTKANLGSVLIALDRPGEALALHREVYEACGDTLGAEHAMTLVAGSRLAQTLHRNGLNEESVALFDGVIAAMDRSPGPESAEAIVARRAQARALRGLGREEAARAVLTEALGHAERAGSRAAEEIRRDLEAPAR